MSEATRTIRELGGELWAELNSRISEDDANFEVRNRIVDIAMGVLARHAGKVLENDQGLPVEPLVALTQDARE